MTTRFARIALCASLLASCSSSAGTFSPNAIYGTIESARMTPQLHARVVAGLHRRIKHVFVIFQENHSFDNYFGTFPGAENLGTAFAKAHGYSQYDPIAKKQQTVFRTTIPDILGPQQYRYVLEQKFDGGKMDKFIAAEERNANGYGYTKFVSRQYGLTTMASYDCDTIPYLWMYAKNFALLDHYFQAETGESSPSALALFAAQSGISQEHRFPGEASDEHHWRGVPVITDMDPFVGPYGGHEWPLQIPQSYANLAMLLGGAASATAARAKPGHVDEDLAKVEASGAKSIPWAWDQEGFVDGSGAVAKPGYEGHHNAPQYFDYVRLNSTYWSHVGTAQQALAAITGNTLPDDSGVYFIKGSSQNEFGWKPANPDKLVQKFYRGDDDHPGPGDSDANVGEAFVATFVNAIAQSKYWSDSAVIVTWDDGGGFFDHVPPRNWEQCNDGYPCGDGQRLPLIVISPFAQAGAVVTDYSDAASVSKFIEATFGLPTMASLPDEAVVQPYGPRDAIAGLSDLAGAFDPGKLDGTVPPNPASTAEVPASQVGHFPPAMNCASLGIHPIAIPAQPPYYDPQKTLLQYNRSMPEASND